MQHACEFGLLGKLPSMVLRGICTARPVKLTRNAQGKTQGRREGYTKKRKYRKYCTIVFRGKVKGKGCTAVPAYGASLAEATCWPGYRPQYFCSANLVGGYSKS
eukprot:1152933-Pelagomonas_calceolata.AAC.7